MTAAATLFVIAAAIAAAGDWAMVLAGRTRPRFLTKPAVILLLVGAAATLEPVSVPERALVVAGLLLGAAGDVLLLLPDEPYFRYGLMAFLAGHLAYAAAFRFLPPSGWGLVLGLVTVAAAAALLVPRLAAGLRRLGQTALAGPVFAYVLVISVMLVSAFATGRPLTMVGAALFYASDALIGWSRFVSPFRNDQLAIIVTYHLGQGALVLSLAA